MNIIFSKLFKIDVTNEHPIERPDYEYQYNFIRYIQDLLTQISEKPSERKYKFNSDYTEVKTLTNNILLENEYIISSNAIAKRLLIKEKDAQTDLDRKNLNKEIIKGMLIIALVRMTDEARKLIISKVDYDEFISEITGDLISGISIKKKVYKAFVCEIDNNNSIIHNLVFDTNTPVSSYWWKYFLELDVVTNDEENTKRAFNAIEKNILNPLKKKHKADYYHIWNSTILFFRSAEEFSIDGYLCHIGDYIPYDENFSMKDFKSKVRNLPRNAKEPFDNRFTLVKGQITKRLKNTIKLTDQIDLLLKHDVPNPSETIQAILGEDGITKYVIIKSPEGYEYFKKHINTLNND